LDNKIDGLFSAWGAAHPVVYNINEYLMFAREAIVLGASGPTTVFCQALHGQAF